MTRKRTDAYVSKTIKTECGCILTYGVAPPRIGDSIICRQHGPTKVISEKAGDKSVGRTSS